jgi:hypothetical protein
MRVKVRQYTRIRLGQQECVGAHTRRWPKPKQLTLPFS